MKSDLKKKKQAAKKRKNWKAVLVKPGKIKSITEVTQFTLAKTTFDMVRNIGLIEELRSHFYDLKNLRMDKSRLKIFKRK